MKRLKLWRERRRDVSSLSQFHEVPPSSSESDDDFEMLSNYESSNESDTPNVNEVEEVLYEEINDEVSCLDSEGDEDENNYGLDLTLKNWAIENNCTRKCINQILGIFNDLNISVPKDSRTLLKTDRNVNSVPMGLGNFVYVGIEKCIRKLLNFKEPASNLIELMINIDGLPVFK